MTRERDGELERYGERSLLDFDAMARLREQETHLRVLSRVVTLVTSDEYSLDEFLTELAQIIQAELGYEHFTIGLKDEDGQVRFHAGYGVPAELKPRLMVKRGKGITGWVLETGQPARVKDVRSDPRYYRLLDQTRAEMCVPLKTHKQVLGVINVESSQVGQFTDQDMAMLTTLASIASGVLARLLR